MTPEQVIAEVERYEAELARIHISFKRTRDGIYIAEGDEALYRQYVHELIDLYNDALGRNSYSAQIAHEFQNGFGYLGSASLKGVENILAVIRASLTRLRRNPEMLSQKQNQEVARKRENVFLIHGRDEAKWRELKDIIQTEFHLNPIILMQQPDAGAKTVIEKFEHYAETCSYAIAVFTPDDEVSSGGETYLQARPNVIYELGWFCGRLGRGNVMLLLREGTSMFSDFGGIIQKRFTTNISEKVVEIRKDLEAAGVLPTT
ncbi:TIR domain-containing protein [Methylobacter luteus]|uniref:TIR domain-containing protein n=1 Tax=Methylobacter luteus TaxID=415 RepID=UPI000429A81E|nr:nucleotide-binding protein [Methylobacter luteus]